MQYLWTSTAIRRPPEGAVVHAEAPHGARLRAVRYGSNWHTADLGHTLHYTPAHWKPIGLNADDE